MTKIHKSDKPNLGTCAICGKYGRLTFEHIPPRSAGNKHPVRMMTLDKFIRESNVNPNIQLDDPHKSSRLNRGSGMFSLCEKCNNTTGSLYGQEYKRVAAAFFQFIANENPQHGEAYTIQLTMHPAQFIRQVISMFMSVDNSSDIRDFQSYLLDKDKPAYVLPNMRITMFISIGSTMRLGGPFGAMSFNDNSTSVGSLATEIITRPLGFTMFRNVDKYQKGFGCDITEMLKFSYNDEIQLTLTLPVVNLYGNFPLDYRTKDEFQNHKPALLHTLDSFFISKDAGMQK